MLRMVDSVNQCIRYQLLKHLQVDSIEDEDIEAVCGGRRCCSVCLERALQQDIDDDTEMLWNSTVLCYYIIFWAGTLVKHLYMTSSWFYLSRFSNLPEHIYIYCHLSSTLLHLFPKCNSYNDGCTWQSSGGSWSLVACSVRKSKVKSANLQLRTPGSFWYLNPYLLHFIYQTLRLT